MARAKTGYRSRLKGTRWVGVVRAYSIRLFFTCGPVGQKQKWPFYIPCIKSVLPHKSTVMGYISPSSRAGSFPSAAGSCPNFLPFCVCFFSIQRIASFLSCHLMHRHPASSYVYTRTGINSYVGHIPYPFLFFTKNIVLTFGRRVQALTVILCQCHVKRTGCEKRNLRKPVAGENAKETQGRLQPNGVEGRGSLPRGAALCCAALCFLSNIQQCQVLCEVPDTMYRYCMYVCTRLFALI